MVYDVQGAKKLGYTPEKIPRNVKDCVDCGHCCNGCPYEAKQSMSTALLEPLLLAGDAYKLHIIPHCDVNKIIYEQGVNGSVSGANGTAYECTKRAVGVECTVRVFEQPTSSMSVGERLEHIAKAPFTTR